MTATAALAPGPTRAVTIPATRALPGTVRVLAAPQVFPAQAECRHGCQLATGLYAGQSGADLIAHNHVVATGHTVVVTAARATVYRAERSA